VVVRLRNPRTIFFGCPGFFVKKPQPPTPTQPTKPTHKKKTRGGLPHPVFFGGQGGGGGPPNPHKKTTQQNKNNNNKKRERGTKNKKPKTKKPKPKNPKPHTQMPQGLGGVGVGLGFFSLCFCFPPWLGQFFWFGLKVFFFWETPGFGAKKVLSTVRSCFWLWCFGCGGI